MVFTNITVTPFVIDHRGTKPVFTIASICGKMPSGRVLKNHINLCASGYDVTANYINDNDVLCTSKNFYDVAFATGIRSSDVLAIFEEMWSISDSIKESCFRDGIGNRAARCNKYDTENPDDAVWEYRII